VTTEMAQGMAAAATVSMMVLMVWFMYQWWTGEL
jgi:hypothetical protein